MRKVELILIYLILQVVLLNTNINLSFGSEYNYEMEGCIQSCMNNTGDRLYTSFIAEDEILVTDALTMEKISSECINIDMPGLMQFSPNGLYLYASCIPVGSQTQNDKIAKIRLSDKHIDYIELTGEIMDFTVSPDGQWIWVVHSTYPVLGERADIMDALSTENQDKCHITRIRTSTFSIENTALTYPLPWSVWYSEFSNIVYVSHQWTIPQNYNFEDPDYQGGITWVGDAFTLEKIKYIVGGQPMLWEPTVKGANWSDDGRYYVSPSTCMFTPFSMRIFDSTDHSIFAEIVIPDPINETARYVNNCVKVPGMDILWVSSEWGEPLYEMDRTRSMIKIDTSSMEYEIYEIPEADCILGYFDVSADGRTLYIPKPQTGSIIVTSPGNNPPECQLEVVTSMPYCGTLPASIEFLAECVDLDNDPLTYHWDFDGDLIFDEPVDDSYTGDPDNPTHVYSANYEGPVNLKVTDNYQGECAVTVMVSVKGI